MSSSHSHHRLLSFLKILVQMTAIFNVHQHCIKQKGQSKWGQVKPIKIYSSWITWCTWHPLPMPTDPDKWYQMKMSTQVKVKLKLQKTALSPGESCVGNWYQMEKSSRNESKPTKDCLPSSRSWHRRHQLSLSTDPDKWDQMEKWKWKHCYQRLLSLLEILPQVTSLTSLFNVCDPDIRGKRWVEVKSTMPRTALLSRDPGTVDAHIQHPPSLISGGKVTSKWCQSCQVLLSFLEILIQLMPIFSIHHPNVG